MGGEILPPQLKNMKVLHAPINIANQMTVMVDGLNRTGIDAISVNLHPEYFNFKSNYTLNLKISEMWEFIHWAASKYDIFNFHFGKSFMPNFADLRYLKSQGKMIVMSFWGSEVRQLDIALKYNEYAFTKFPDDDIRLQLITLGKLIDGCIVHSEELRPHVENYFKNIIFIPSSINISEYPYSPYRNEKFTIVHAPTDTKTNIKGTDIVVGIIEELQKDYDFKFVLVKGMSHEEAKALYRQSHLVIDELKCGDYGLLAVECMSFGCTVMTYICDYMKKIISDSCPIISVTKDTLKDSVKKILENKKEVAEYGQAGNKYVKVHHNIDINVEKLAAYYGSL